MVYTEQAWWNETCNGKIPRGYEEEICWKISAAINGWEDDMEHENSNINLSPQNYYTFRNLYVSTSQFY